MLKDYPQGEKVINGKKYQFGKSLTSEWIDTQKDGSQYSKWIWLDRETNLLSLSLRVDDFVDKGYWSKVYKLPRFEATVKDQKLVVRQQPDGKIVYSG